VRGNAIKLAYKFAGWPAQLATSAFNQLSQYTNSPGHRAYSFTKLAIFFPSGIHNHCYYSFRLPTEGWPGWVGLGGLVKYQDGIPTNGHLGGLVKYQDVIPTNGHPSRY